MYTCDLHDDTNKHKPEWLKEEGMCDYNSCKKSGVIYRFYNGELLLLELGFCKTHGKRAAKIHMARNKGFKFGQPFWYKQKI